VLSKDIDMVAKRYLHMLMGVLLIQPQFLVCNENLDESSERIEQIDQELPVAEDGKTEKKAIQVHGQVKDDGSFSLNITTGDPRIDKLLTVTAVFFVIAWKWGCFSSSSPQR
jgi:hypothetical protein